MTVQRSNDKHKISNMAMMITIVSCAIFFILVILGVGYIWIETHNVNEVKSVEKEPNYTSAPKYTNNPNNSVDDEKTEAIKNNDDTQPVSIKGQGPIQYKNQHDEEVINILIIGSDAYPSQTSNGRCDTIMILSYDKKNNHAHLTSFLRDIWLHIEERGYNRLNATYAYGGIDLTMNTINDTFDLDIQNYIIVSFDGMVSLVNQLGGIDVEINEEEAKYYNDNCGWSIRAGINHLDGEMTLIHALNRKSGGGDFERTRRQREIMLAVYQNILEDQSTKTILELLEFFINHTQTNLTVNKLFPIVMSSFSNSGVEISQGQIPIDNTWKYDDMNGKSIIEIDINENKEYLSSMLFDEY